MRGDRLSQLVTHEKMKLAAATVLLSPFIPLLFMGEEYGETAPFPFFVSHSDPATIEATRQGRLAEFAAFQWSEKPPDPQDEATFYSAKLTRHLSATGHHHVIYEYYRELISLRKGISAFARPTRQEIEILAYEQQKLLVVLYGSAVEEAAVFFHFGGAFTAITAPLSVGNWTRRLDSADEQWNGPGCITAATLVSGGDVSVSLAPFSVVLFTRDREDRDDG